MSRLQRPNKEYTASRTSGKPLNHRVVRPPASSPGSRFSLRYKRLTGRAPTSKSTPSARGTTQPSQAGEDALRGVRDVLCEVYEGRISRCRSEIERLEDENNKLRQSLSDASQREVEEDLQAATREWSRAKSLLAWSLNELKSILGKGTGSDAGNDNNPSVRGHNTAPTRASDEENLRPISAGQFPQRESSSARNVTGSVAEKDPSAGLNPGEAEPSADETEGFVDNSLGRSSPPPHVKNLTDVAPEDSVSTFQGESSSQAGLITVRYPDRVAESAHPVAVEYPRQRPCCGASLVIVYPRHGGHGSDEVVKVRYPSDVIFTLPQKQLAEDLKFLDTSTETISYPRVLVRNTTEITYEGGRDDRGGPLPIDEQIPEPPSPSEEPAAVGRSAASAATYKEGEDTRADGSVHDDSGHAGEVRFPSPLGHEVSSTVVYPKPGPADDGLAPVRYPSAPATSERALFVEYPWRNSDEASSIISYPRCDDWYDDEGVPTEAAGPSLDDSDSLARPEESKEVIEISATPEKSKGSTGIDEDPHLPSVPPAQPASPSLVDSDADSKSSCGLPFLSMVDNSVSVAVTYPMIVIGTSSSTKLIKIRYPDPCSLSGSSVFVNYPSNLPHEPLPNVVYPSVVEQRNSEVLQRAMALPSSEAELRSAELCGGSRESPALAETILYPRAAI